MTNKILINKIGIKTLISSKRKIEEIHKIEDLEELNLRKMNKDKFNKLFSCHSRKD